MAPNKAQSKYSINSDENVFTTKTSNDFKYKYSDYESGAETDDDYKRINSHNKDNKLEIKTISNRMKFWISILLTVLNLLNYIDRFTILAISESKLKCYFQQGDFSLKDEDIGKITTMFYIAYMLISPAVGYFGGKYKRKLIVSIGISVWIAALVLGAMIEKKPDDTENDVKNKWWMLLATRSLFGMGEACYICLATAIIHDLYIEDSQRMNWLIIFSMAIPVGSGLGYILGAKIADIFNWQVATAFNVPVTFAVLLIWIFYIPDVPHGYSDMMKALSEKHGKEAEKLINEKHERKRSYKISLSEKNNEALDLMVTESDQYLINRNNNNNNLKRLDSNNNKDLEIKPIIITNEEHADKDERGQGQIEHNTTNEDKTQNTNQNQTQNTQHQPSNPVNNSPGGSDHDDLIVDSDDSNPKAVLKTNVKSFDLKVSLTRLWGNKTYKFTTIGFTAVCWSLGAGTTFIPILFQRSTKLAEAMINEKEIAFQNFTESDINTIERSPEPPETLSYVDADSGQCGSSGAGDMITFGIIATVSGLCGAYFGGTAAQKWKSKGNVSSETDVCALGVLFGAVFLYVCFIVASMKPIIYYLVFFIGLTCINLTWAVINKIILSVVHPYDKSLGASLLNLITHALGDVISPLIVGKFSTLIGDLIKKYDQFDGGDPDGNNNNNNVDLNKSGSDDPFVEFLKIQQALMIVPIVCALGSLSFFKASLHYKEDLGEVAKFQKEMNNDNSEKEGS